MRYRFLLVGGMYLDKEGNVYVKNTDNNIVESDEDLREKFPSHFELLLGDGKPEIPKDKEIKFDEVTKEAIEALGERRRSRKTEDPKKERKTKKRKKVQDELDEDEEDEVEDIQEEDEEEERPRKKKRLKTSKQGKRRGRKLRSVA